MACQNQHKAAIAHVEGAQPSCCDGEEHKQQPRHKRQMKAEAARQLLPLSPLRTWAALAAETSASRYVSSLTSKYRAVLFSGAFALPAARAAESAAATALPPAALLPGRAAGNSES